MIKVLVVDDSAFARLSIARQLAADGGIEIVGYANDGLEAIEKVKELKPNVVTLDVEMPKMDGLEALSRIMADSPTPVIMLSSLTDKGTDITVRALELGATDYFLKAPKATTSDFFGLDDTLIAKVKLAAAVGNARHRTTPLLKHLTVSTVRKTVPEQTNIKPSKVVVIGSSTGGPGALYQVIPRLPGDLPAALLVVQHMPPMFTKSLANRLNELSNIRVKEAESGDHIETGLALLAPGNFHMEVKMGDRIAMNQKPPIWGVRPSVDVTMLSASLIYGAATMGVILTGMGCDGTNGSASVKAGGGKILAQDEATCVVYGMPRSVVESGNADKVVPLQEMAAEIVKYVGAR